MKKITVTALVALSFFLGTNQIIEIYAGGYIHIIAMIANYIAVIFGSISLAKTRSNKNK